MIGAKLTVSSKKENGDETNVLTEGRDTNRRNSKKRDISSDNLERKIAGDSKNIGHFILGDKLGEGTFGVVRMATHILTGEKVAVKILEKIKILGKDDKTRVEREIKILKCLRHNNIVQLYSVIQTVTTIYLIMEYASGKELFDYIVLKKRLPEAEACKFYQQLLFGIEYLHKLRIVHRDLKPENLLLDHKKDLKIADFGLSNLYGKGELLKTACGSPCYAAPEMIASKRYSGVTVDIWSSGIILYAMMCGYLPFEDPDNSALYKKITDGKFSIPNYVSDAGKDLIKKILNTDPNKRYTISQIKSHPWFNAVSPRLNTNEGLLINLHVIPIDESLVSKMVEYDFNKEEVRINVLSNRHNHISTTYYLLLKNKIRKGNHSIADLISDEFIEYLKDNHNLLSRYSNDLNIVIQERASSKASLNEENQINLDAAKGIEDKERVSNATSQENLSNNNSTLINNISNNNSKNFENSNNQTSIPNNNKKETLELSGPNKVNTNLVITNSQAIKITNKMTNKIPTPGKKINITNQNTNKITSTSLKPSNDMKENNGSYLTTEAISKVHNDIKEINNFNILQINQNNEKPVNNDNKGNNINQKESNQNVVSDYNQLTDQTNKNLQNSTNVTQNMNGIDKFIKKQINLNQNNLNDKNYLESKSILKRLNNKRTNMKNNFFNTSMSFDQNADAKNTTFDQEIIKNLEAQDFDSKKLKIEKEKAHYKPLGSIKERERDKLVDYNSNSNNNYQVSMTDTNYCDKKTNTKFDIIKEEEEYTKRLSVEENKRRLNNLSPIKKNGKYNTTYIKAVSPKKAISSQTSRNSPEKQNGIDYKTITNFKNISLENSSGIKNEYKSNLTKPSYKHHKNLSEPYAEKYVLTQNHKTGMISKSPINEITNIKSNNYMKINLITNSTDKKRDLSTFTSNNKNITNTEANSSINDAFSKTSNSFNNQSNSANSYVKKGSKGNKVPMHNNEFKTFKGPLDISCVFFDSSKIIKIELTKILNLNKITYKNPNNSTYRYLCDKSGLKFEIEIYKLSEPEGFFILKFRKTEGSLTIFRDICRLILMKINS